MPPTKGILAQSFTQDNALGTDTQEVQSWLTEQVQLLHVLFQSTDIQHNFFGMSWPKAKPSVFEDAGMHLLKRVGQRWDSSLAMKRRWRGSFGICPRVCAHLWLALPHAIDAPRGVLPMHLLWALMFLREYMKEESLAKQCDGVDEQTIRKWVWIMVNAISLLEAKVVRAPCFCQVVIQI